MQYFIIEEDGFVVLQLVKIDSPGDGWIIYADYIDEFPTREEAEDYIQEREDAST